MKVRDLTMCVAMGMLLAPAMRTQGQTGASRPQFEVASVKLNNGCDVRAAGNPNPSPGRFEMPCVTLRNLIQYAYGTFADPTTINVQPLRMEGLPRWAQSEYYSLAAKAAGPARPEMMAGPMLQAFLEERFQLKVHRETREMPVYALTVGKGGLKTQPLPEGDCDPIDLSHPPSPKPGQPMPNLCGVMMAGIDPKGIMTIEVRAMNMTEFAQRLSGRVDRTVVDRTGVAGRYTFHLEYTPQPGFGGRRGDAGNPADPSNPAPVADPAPTIFTALQELGLKLVSEKGPGESLVIEHVEKPTAN